MRKFVFAALLCGALAVPALAQNVAISMQSSVFVEKLGYSRQGKVERTITPASRLKRGDRLVLVVQWQGSPGQRSFAVTSAVPSTIAYENASSEDVLVSADGGKSWGALGTLKITDRDGTRLVSPEDVTHLRWQIGAHEARRGNGRLTYSAIVR